MGKKRTEREEANRQLARLTRKIRRLEEACEQRKKTCWEANRLIKTYTKIYRKMFPDISVCEVVGKFFHLLVPGPESLEIIDAALKKIEEEGTSLWQEKDKRHLGRLKAIVRRRKKIQRRLMQKRKKQDSS